MKNPRPKEPVQPVPIKLTFNLSIFPASERTKEMKKHQGHNSYLKLNSDIPFDTWKAQILMKIDEKMKLNYISYEDYEVSFMILRISPQPLSITNEEDYNLLCERTQKAKDQQATVDVQELKAVRLTKVHTIVHVCNFLTTIDSANHIQGRKRTVILRLLIQAQRAMELGLVR